MDTNKHTHTSAFVRENVKYNTHRQTNVDTSQHAVRIVILYHTSCNRKTTACAILIDFCVELVMLYVAIVCFGGCLRQRHNNNSCRLYITSTMDVQKCSFFVGTVRVHACNRARCFRNAIGRLCARALHRARAHTKPNMCGAVHTHTLMEMWSNAGGGINSAQQRRAERAAQPARLHCIGPIMSSQQYTRRDRTVLALERVANEPPPPTDQERPATLHTEYNRSARWLEHGRPCACRTSRETHKIIGQHARERARA